MANIKSRSKAPSLSIMLAVLFVASLIFGGYYFAQYQSLKDSSSKTAEEKNQELVAKINEVYELPKDEEPVVAIVSDEETFKKEYPVFTSAKKGDSLLLYEKAGQAILYRESENKIVGTATFAVQSGTSVQIIAPGEIQNTTEQTIVAKLANAVRVGAKSTPNGQYSATTVVDLTGQKADLAKQIADSVGGTVAGTLPATEKASEGAEIVVIVANAVAAPPAETPLQ